MVDPREIIAAQNLAGVPHGFLTGVGHEGAPDSALILAGSVLVCPKQVHSARALVVDGPFAEGEIPEVDALVTATIGLVLGIVTADCGPVLLADKEAGVVGAAHAGWRGAFDGVLESSIAAMETLGARRENICAAIGPMIAQKSYEVDESLRIKFGAQAEKFFAAGIDKDHFQFDLEGYIAAQLADCGLRHIERLGLDTYVDSARFHSFRRTTHRAEPTYGRQYSLIALPD